MMNFVVKPRNCVLKTRNCAFKTTNSALKMMNLVGPFAGRLEGECFVINEDFSIENANSLMILRWRVEILPFKTRCDLTP